MENVTFIVQNCGHAQLLKHNNKQWEVRAYGKSIYIGLFSETYDIYEQYAKYF